MTAKTLHEDLLLLKKSARCVTKMLFKRMKKELDALTLTQKISSKEPEGV
jgi:hypothetical protein